MTTESFSFVAYFAVKIWPFEVVHLIILSEYDLKEAYKYTSWVADVIRIISHTPQIEADDDFWDLVHSSKAKLTEARFEA